MKVQDVIDLYRNYPKDAEVCPYCHRQLEEVEGGRGGNRVLYCPSEMCLHDEQTIVEGGER